MSIILANFGKYAISDCPFITIVVKGTSVYEIRSNNGCYAADLNIIHYGPV